MAILNRSQILEAKDIKTETIFIPEWNGEVIVKGLTGTERDAYEASILDLKTKGGGQVNWVNARAKFVAYSVVDESGNRLFTEADVKALGAKSSSAINRIFDAAQKLSGLSNTDLDELTKN